MESHSDDGICAVHGAESQQGLKLVGHILQS